MYQLYVDYKHKHDVIGDEIVCETSGGFCAVFYTLKRLRQWNSLLPVSSRLRRREEETFIYSASPGAGAPAAGLPRLV